MRKLSILFNLGLLLALILPPRLHAQTATNPPADPNSKVANAQPADQAPDEMTKKIAELVHAGKYAEAQKLTAGLLVAYPDDRRLIKAKALIEKLLSPASSANTAPSSQPTNAVAPGQPTLNTSAEPLTGMERIDYNALVELARQAQQTADLPQQNKLVRQFMDQSGVFLQKHPDQMLIWQLRAAAAIIENDPMEGYEAGQKLMTAGAAESNDPNLQRLLAQLKNKGWLDKQGAEQAQEQRDKPRDISVTFTGDALDGGMFHQNGQGVMVINLRTRIERDVIVQLQSRFPHTNVRINTPDSGDSALRLTINLHDTDLDDKCAWWSCDVYATSQLQVSVTSPAGPLVDRTFRLQTKRSVSKGGSAWDIQRAAPVLQEWMGQEVLGKFQSVLDEDAVRTALANPSPGAAIPVPSSAPN
jgi:hypothetical protein